MSQPQANHDSTLIDDVVSISTADVEWEESCDQCPLDEVTEYSHVCTECMVHLCQFHVSGHQRHRLTKDHDLIAKTDVIPDDLVSLVNNRRSALKFAKNCIYHPHQTAELYCIECNLFVCQLCSFSDAHVNHTLKIVSDYASVVKNSFKDKNYGDSPEELAQRKAKVDSRRELNRRVCDQMLEKLQASYDAKKEAMEKQYEQIKGLISEYFLQNDTANEIESAQICSLLSKFEAFRSKLQLAEVELNHFDLIQSAHNLNQVVDNSATLPPLPDFVVKSLNVSECEQDYFQCKMTTPFEIRFSWNGSNDKFSIFLSPKLNTISQDFTRVCLLVTSSDFDKRTEMHNFTLNCSESGEKFLVGEIEADDFCKLEIYDCNTNALIAEFTEKANCKNDGNTRRPRQKEIIEELFRLNGWSDPSYDEQTKRFKSQYCTEWLYTEHGFLTSM